MNANITVFLIIAAFLGLIGCSNPQTTNTDSSEAAQMPVPIVFPDTQENQRIVTASYLEYLEIDKVHGRDIEVNGINMHYLEWGNDSGTPLIWSHGYSSTAFEMSNTGAKLADAGYHVYAISYRGHGQTQVNDYNFSLSHIADDIAAMLDKLGISKAVIGGLSLGGGVATTFYENYPERTLALALEDGGADSVQVRTEKLYEQVKEYMADIPPYVDPVFQDRFEGFQYISNFFLPSWGGSLPPGTGPMIASWIVENDDGTFGVHYNGPKLFGDRTVAAMEPAQSHKLPLLHQSWRRVHPIITYRNLSVPMLIIDPTGDDFKLGIFYEELRALHPDLITVVEYENTPHAAHPMRPDWFVRDMGKLLAQVKK